MNARIRIIRNFLFILALLLVLSAPDFAAYAQVESEPPDAVAIDRLLSEALAYLTVHLAIIATALQYIFNELKMGVEMVGKGWFKLSDEHYNVFVRVIRFVFVGFVYTFLAGGVPVTRTFLPSLSMFPDAFFWLLTVGVVGAGTEVQYGLIKFITTLQEGRSLIIDPDKFSRVQQTETKTTVATQ